MGYLVKKIDHMHFPLFNVIEFFDQIFHCVQPNLLDYEATCLEKLNELLYAPIEMFLNFLILLSKT